MIKLEPRLVSFNFTTRVIAPNDLSEEELHVLNEAMSKE